MDIRPGSPIDTDACIALWLAALEARDGEPQEPAVAHRARAKFDRPLVRFAVAGSEPVAFALTVDAGHTEGPKVAVFELLAVAPGESGRGLGRALLADAIRSARNLGYSRVELHVREGNSAAEHLYETAGFAVDGEPAPHPLGGRSMVKYVRELPDA